MTVLTRGGLAQSSLLVETIPLEQLPPGYVTTVAGGSTFAGDGLTAQRAEIGFPAGSDLDSAGNLYFADPGNHRIRRVAAATGIITSVAGIGEPDFSGDGSLVHKFLNTLTYYIRLIWHCGNLKGVPQCLDTARIRSFYRQVRKENYWLVPENIRYRIFRYSEPR